MDNTQLLCGDAENLPISDTDFDGVLCSSAIVWFPNIPQALKEWFRVLRAGGWIAFSCFGLPSTANDWEIMNWLLRKYGQVVSELNGRLNTPSKCQHLLDKAGFIFELSYPVSSSQTV